MNNQEAFDKMVTHLFTQKEQAINPLTTECYYRMDCGKMCAVGALIPDEQYQETFEGQASDDIQQLIPALSYISPDLLGRAQSIHDGREFEEWYDEFNELAKQFGLDTTVLETYEHALLENEVG